MGGSDPAGSQLVARTPCCCCDITHNERRLRFDDPQLVWGCHVRFDKARKREQSHQGFRDFPFQQFVSLNRVISHRLDGHVSHFRVQDHPSSRAICVLGDEDLNFIWDSAGHSCCRIRTGRRKQAVHEWQGAIGSSSEDAHISQRVAFPVDLRHPVQCAQQHIG